MSTTLPLIRVLVVNDQREMCELWQRIIDMSPGMSCPAYAMDGEEALKLVEELAPDVVFMDVLMPHMAGDVVARQIRERFPDIVVILYSAFTHTEQRAYEAGAAEFVVMPVQPDKLIALIRRAYIDHRHPDI